MSKVLRDMKAWYLHVTEGFVWIGAIALFLMMTYGFADITGRYLANYPMPGTYEISKTFMVFIVFLSFSYIQVRKGHMRIEFITKRLGSRGKVIVDMVAYLIGLVLFALITWQASYWSWQSWVLKDYIEGIHRIPYFPARSAVAIGSFFFCVQLIIDILGCMHKLFSQKPGMNEQ